MENKTNDDQQSQQSESQRKPKRKHRGHGEGSITQRKDGRFQAQLTLEDGTRKTFYGKTRKEAADKLDQAKYEQKEHILATGPQQKFKDYLLQWFEEVQKPTLRPSSIEREERDIRNHILPALGHIQLKKLTAQQLHSFYTSKRKEGYAPRSILNMHKIIHKALANAVKWRLISYNMSDGITLPKGKPEREAQALTMEQVWHLLDAAKGHELEAMIVLLLDTGMRHGEVTALRWDDVDLNTRTVYIHRTESRLNQGHVEGNTKTASSERLITLSPAVLPVLETHRVRQQEMKQRLGARWQEMNLVFPSRTGRYLEKTNTTKRFYRLLDQAGLPRIRLHDLRHTAITLMQEMGLNQKAIQERVGHADMSMTWKYTHVSRRMQEEIVSKLDMLLWRQKPSS